MKASKYNFFANAEDGKVIAFNFLSNGLLKMSPDDYRRYREASNSDWTVKPEGPVSAEFVETLKEGGFLIDDDIEEKSLIKYRQESDKYGTSKSYALTVGVTTNCNFKCEYCYEKADKHGAMSREVENKIIDYISELPSGSSLSVNWYGGEPLLNTDIIYRMSDIILKIVSEKNIKYTAGIITNGYLYDRETALELKKRKCITSQISLDAAYIQTDTADESTGRYGTGYTGGGLIFQRKVLFKPWKRSMKGGPSVRCIRNVR